MMFDTYNNKTAVFFYIHMYIHVYIIILLFQEGRYEIAMDTEMEYFIPNFKQKKEETERAKSGSSLNWLFFFF